MAVLAVSSRGGHGGGWVGVEDWVDKRGGESVCGEGEVCGVEEVGRGG